MEIGLRPMTAGGGTMPVAATTDISTRQRADANFRAIFDAAPCGMVLIDAQGCIGMVNQRLCEKFGYASHEMLGRPIDKMISPGAGIDVPLPLLGYTGVRRFRPFAPRRGCPGQVRA